MKKVFCGFESLSPSRGGIAKVGRLISRVVADISAAGMADVAGVSLSDNRSSPDLPPWVKGSSNSRWKFLSEISKASFRYSHFLYDYVGIARAHGWVPFPRRPFLGFIHGYEVWSGLWPRRKCIAVAKRAACLMTNSAYTRNRAAESDATFERAHVCWLATEEDAPAAVHSPSSGPPQVLIVGRIDEGFKGHKELIDCWAKVVDAVPEANLIVAGNGPRFTKYKALAAASPAADRIQFRGFVSPSELHALWQNATVFALPGRMEGFGLVYIEAMRQGVPIIASVHDAAPEINLHGVTGYNVDLDKTDDLADRIVQLLRDRDQALKMGMNGRARWAENFRFTHFKQRFQTIFHGFIS